MALALLLSPYQQRVDQCLRDALVRWPSADQELQQAMEYALLLGGKRVRPVLTYLTGEACGAGSAALDSAATAIECIHAYSLVHDDLPAMDDDALRRGKPTVHIAFNEATAILAGDAMQTLAFQILTEPLAELATPRQLQLVAALAQASGAAGMCGGQALDLAATGKQQTETELATMHRLKTGALIQAAITMGVLCGSDEAQQYQADFAEFGAHLGLAFQVQDDVLDVIGDTQVLGKPQGSDSAAEKSTYVQLLGLDGARMQMQHLHDKALQALARIPYNTDKLSKLANILLTRDH